jgi:hypothetical protein
VRRAILASIALLLVSMWAPSALADRDTYCRQVPEDPACQETTREDVTYSTIVTVDGRDCAVAPIVVVDGRTTLPLRAFSECLGLNVHWFAADNGWDGTAVISGAIGSFGRQFAAYFRPQAEDFTTKVTEALPQRTMYYRLDVAPYLLNDRTMVPFRFVTDAANVSVEWIQGNESRPNEVRVNTREMAQPVDQWEAAAQHVGYSDADGFYLKGEPAGGWDIYPSTLRHVRYGLELYSRIVKDRKGAGTHLDLDPFRVRVYDEYGLIDYRGPVVIRWMTDEERSIRYGEHVNRNRKLISGGAGVVSGVLTLFFGAKKAILETLLSGSATAISGWNLFTDDLQGVMQSCNSIAALDKYQSRIPTGAPASFGYAFTPNGVRCVPYYSDDPLSILVKPS